MKKTINVELIELSDNDTVCGYRVKDIIAITKVLEQEGITAVDLRKFINNIEFAYKVVQHNIEKTVKNTMLGASGKAQ